jgi:hypothetical protein
MLPMTENREPPAGPRKPFWTSWPSVVENDCRSGGPLKGRGSPYLFLGQASGNVSERTWASTWPSRKAQLPGAAPVERLRC